MTKKVGDARLLWVRYHSPAAVHLIVSAKMRRALPCGTFMKKIAWLLLLTLSVATVSFAADTYHQGKILKWENGTYAEKNKSKSWVIYQLQADGTTYSIARHKETKPQMQAGESVQYQLKKKNQINVIDANGKKHEYQIVGQTAGPGQ
jgi:hypothetical protein